VSAPRVYFYANLSPPIIIAALFTRRTHAPSARNEKKTPELIMHTLSGPADTIPLVHVASHIPYASICNAALFHSRRGEECQPWTILMILSLISTEMNTEYVIGVIRRNEPTAAEHYV